VDVGLTVRKYPIVLMLLNGAMDVLHEKDTGYLLQNTLYVFWHDTIAITTRVHSPSLFITTFIS
jgi:hypothetical protein